MVLGMCCRAAMSNFDVVHDIDRYIGHDKVVYQTVQLHFDGIFLSNGNFVPNGPLASLSKKQYSILFVLWIDFLGLCRPAVCGVIKCDN